MVTELVVDPKRMNQDHDISLQKGHDVFHIFILAYLENGWEKFHLSEENAL